MQCDSASVLSNDAVSVANKEVKMAHEQFVDVTLEFDGAKKDKSIKFRVKRQQNSENNGRFSWVA